MAFIKLLLNVAPIMFQQATGSSSGKPFLQNLVYKLVLHFKNLSYVSLKPHEAGSTTKMP